MKKLLLLGLILAGCSKNPGPVKYNTYFFIGFNQALHCEKISTLWAGVPVLKNCQELLGHDVINPTNIVEIKDGE